MADTLPFDELMARLRDGDEAAANEVFGRFVRRLIGLSSSQFDSWIRPKADPEDIVQSAYKSFFLRYERGDFELADWESLWGLLAVITIRKSYRRRDYLMADCRDAGREVSPPQGGDDSSSRWEFIDREPTPSEMAILSETVDGLLEGLERPEREIVELSLQGHTTPEISDRLGRSQRTVQRVRERVKERLRRLQVEEVDE